MSLEESARYTGSVVEMRMGIEPIYNSSAGLNRLDQNIDWKLFAKWLDQKYSKRYATLTLIYAKKHYGLLNNARDLVLVKESVRNNATKALIVLSKYLGFYDKFHADLKNFGITLHRQNSLESFLRILKSNGNNDINSWVEESSKVLQPNENLYLQFVRSTGIRMSEAITSFNLIIQLCKEGKLEEYYDKDLNCLCHFKYPKLFIRNTKNVYISFIEESKLSEIANSRTVTYNQIRKKLNRAKIPVKINELRDYFGTYLLQHGILEQEVNLLQGRIPISVFVRHYWSPKLKELSNKVLTIGGNLEKTLLS